MLNSTRQSKNKYKRLSRLWMSFLYNDSRNVGLENEETTKGDLSHQALSIVSWFSRRIQVKDNNTHETELRRAYSFHCVSKGFPRDEIENGLALTSVSVASLAFPIAFSCILSRGEATPSNPKQIRSKAKQIKVK